jgi:hypothetical protein
MIQIQSYAVIEFRCPIDTVIGKTKFYQIPTLKSLQTIHEKVNSLHFSNLLPYRTHVEGIYKVKCAIADVELLTQLITDNVIFCTNSSEEYNDWCNPITITIKNQ